MENIKNEKDNFIMDNRPAMSGVIDHFEEKYAVIQTDDKQQLLWPRESLTNDFKEGMVVKLSLSTNEMETKDREKMVKDLLNQILRKSS